MRGPFAFPVLRSVGEGGRRSRAGRGAGFSLLEVLSVLLVIAVLGGIALPASRTHARLTGLRSRWRSS